MPFKSVAMRKFMWANHPEIAREWTKKYGSKIQPGKKNVRRRKPGMK